MKKKLLSLILASLMSISLLTGCSSNVHKEVSKENQKATIATKITEPVEITFWHAMNGDNEAAIKKITDDFKLKNPNITVKLINQGKYPDLFDKLMASAKSKQMPTMSQIYSNRLSWYVSKDLVEDLNPYIKDSETGMKTEEIEDIPKLFLNDGIWDGKQYAMPLNKSQMVLYYNEEMLEKAGIGVPTTWEEWSEASKKLTVNKDGNTEVYGCVFENNISTDIAPWIKQSGGDIIDEVNNKVNFDSQATNEAVSFLNNMIKDKTARLAGDDENANIPIQDGRAAMCVASTSALPFIEEGTKEGITIKAAALPGNKTNVQLFYGTNVAVFNSGTKEQKQAAYEYIKYLTSTENTAYFAAETGYIPVRKSAQKDPVFAKVLAEKPIKKLSFDCFDNGFQGARIIGEKNALDELGKQLDLVFSGKKDVEPALKDAQKSGEDALKKAQSN